MNPHMNHSVHSYMLSREDTEWVSHMKITEQYVKTSNTYTETSSYSMCKD